MDAGEEREVPGHVREMTGLNDCLGAAEGRAKKRHRLQLETNRMTRLEPQPVLLTIVGVVDLQGRAALMASPRLSLAKTLVDIGFQHAED